MGVIEIIGLILGGGGVGSFITWMIHLKSEKRIKKAEADEREYDAAHKANTVSRDKFESMYIQINKMMGDYNQLSDEYRKYRQDSLDQERSFLSRLSEKCQQMAEMKSQIQYLKGLRCYNTSCPNRIKFNPDKQK